MLVLALVLLQTHTHCWHWLCRQPDKSKSTGIWFDSLCGIDLNWLFPALLHFHMLVFIERKSGCQIVWISTYLTFQCGILCNRSCIVRNSENRSSEVLSVRESWNQISQITVNGAID